MRRLILICGMGLAAVVATHVNAQVSQPDDSFQQQPQQQPRDITNQDIVDKAELDSRSERRAKARSKKGDEAVPATAADIISGSPLYDKDGLSIGTVEAVGAEGVVVATSGRRVMVPLESFGKNSRGLLLAIKKSDFDQMVTGTAPGSSN